MKRILIVKTSALGDIIHTFPTLNYLRSKFPDAQIDWVAEAHCADLVKAHPAVSNVLVVDTKAWRRSPLSLSTFSAVRAFRKNLRKQTYDVIFDLQGNTKSGLILLQAKGKVKVGFGQESVAEWPNRLFTTDKFEIQRGNNIREDYLSLAAAYFSEQAPVVPNQVELHMTDAQRLQMMSALANPVHHGKAKVIVCPGSAWKNKQMNEQALIAFLKKAGKRLGASFLFAWGTPAELSLANELHGHFPDSSAVLDKMPLPQLQNLMAHAELVIAMDSLPLHLAGTTNTPSASVFGPSSAAKYCPAGPRHFAYQGPCPYGRTFEKRCPVLRTCPTGACMRSLTGDEVFLAFDRWWSRVEEETGSETLLGHR